MKPKVNQEQRAFKAWTVLTSYAANKKTITYGELAEKLNIHHRVISFVLGVIQNYCLENELPPLTILVLNKHSGLPGDGFIAYDIENSQDGIEKVQAFDWTTIDNPFQYAQIGTTENELINDLVQNPDSSSEVYRRVRVRGIAQRIFRQALLKVYESSCAVCGLSFEEALEGSHIIAYSQSSSKQRLDVRNGLLLCSNHHKLFDNGYITITDNYGIHIYDNEQQLGSYTEYDKLMTINFHGKQLKLPKDEKHFPNKEYLKNHRENG